MRSAGIISFKIVPGEKQALEAPADIVLSQVALDAELHEQTRTTLKMTYLSQADVPDSEDDEVEAEEEEEPADGPPKTFVLANLIPGAIESQTLGGLIISEGEKIVWEVTGKNTVHISGNIILQDDLDDPPFDFDEDDEDEMEEGDSELDDELENMSAADKNALLKSLTRPVEEEVAVPVKAEKKEKKAKEVEPSMTKAESKKRRASDAVSESSKPASSSTAATAAPAAKKVKVQEPEKKAPVPEKKEKKQDKPESAAPAKKAYTTQRGVKVLDNKSGEGPGAKNRQTLSMRYILKLANGKIVDSNTKGKPFKFVLGAGEVIKGWDEGLAGMKVGGERTLEVPPDMGYGKRKMSDIPANSTLFFEVKLLDISK